MQAMTKNKRLPPEARGLILLDVAVREAKKHGLANLKRVQVATAAGVSEALVSARLGTMINLRRAVMRQAVANGDLRIVAEGLASRDPIAMKAPAELRERAAASMVR
jgi:hypothetical protein